MNKRLINNTLVAVFAIVILVLAFLVIKPILVSLIFGLICAYIFHPVYRKIHKSIKNRSLAAALLLIIIAVVIIVPIVFFTPILIEQSFGIFNDLRQINFAESISVIIPSIQEGSTAYSLLLNLNNIPGKIMSSFTDYIFSFIINIPNILLQLIIFLFVLFFAVRDSHKLSDYISEVSPFSKATENRFLREFRNITNAVIVGQVLIGIIQGLALGLGLWLLGVEHVLTWTIIAAVMGIIPVIGPWIVGLPIALYLFMAGDVTAAIILAIYSTIFVSNIDNFIRPYILSRTTKLSVVVGLVGTIGGLYFLGIIGLVLGPLILAYALIIIDFYKEGRLDEMFREIHPKGGIASYEIKN